MNPDEEIQNIVDRMRCFFLGTGMKSASRKTVEKWAAEIEAQLRVNAGLKPERKKEKR